jgi:acetyltransferase-like isoleucine patch superfamily enzyme
VPRVVNGGRIELGCGIRLISKWTPIELSTAGGGTIEIGDESSINYGTIVSAASHVRIGRRVMIGNYCVIADTNVPGTPADDEDIAKPIEIGDDVWLAVRVTVLPGAKIGNGAIISAGSVVDGEIPAGALAGGVPARVLRASLRPSQMDLSAIEATT